MKGNTKENKKGICALAAKSFLQTVLALGALCLFWVIAYVWTGNELLVPSFLDSMQELGDLLVDGGFWIGFISTLKRVLLAFLFSFVFGWIFALISYLYPLFRKICMPFLSLFRSLPTLAVLLILLVISGAGKAPIIVAILSLFPILYTEILASLLGIDENLLQMSKVYKVPLKKQIVKLYLPSIAPSIARESGAGVAFSLKLVVSAEVLAQTYQSVGGMMQEAKLYMEMPRLFALVAVTFLTGLVLETVGAYLAERWKK